MTVKDNEKIRQSVRERYGKIARTPKDAFEVFETQICCGQPDILTPEKKVSGCGCNEKSFNIKNHSNSLGYSTNDVYSAPDGANLGLGCGNPLALASLKPGETVVDLGSGGGFDCFLAARKVGDAGRVIGVDMTPNMISKARENVIKSGFNNVEFRLGEIENLPVRDEKADIIISNCVINLSPDKLRVYKEAFRVLKPGGRLSFSDIVALSELPEEIQQNLALVSACVGGAATIDQTKAMLKEAGFKDIRIIPKEESRALINEWVPGVRAGNYVVSATIEAVKI